MRVKKSKPQPPTYQQRARANILKWIAATGARQGDVGAQLSPSRNSSWMSRFLRGQIDADVDTLHQIAAYFKNDYAALFGAEGDVIRTDDVTAALRARLGVAFAAMPETKRELLVLLAEEFAESLVAPRRGAAGSARPQ